MELGLSLGDASNQQFGFMGGRKKSNNNNNQNKNQNQNFSMNLSIGSGYYDEITENPSPIQLNLLSSDSGGRRGFDVNRTPAPSTFEEDDGEDNEVGMAMSSSPSGTSSFQMDLCIGNGHKTGDNINNYHNNVGSGCYVLENGDEDENGGGSRKKLRLSKDQSAFLEESFKEHNTLNPNQKIALAKQLNLRPRQIEVWFQNRRARTKLKQTEVDCEYLKRCCETLTEENRRLHKELQELRTLKSSNSNPFNMQLPATTLTICPSCDRTISNKAAASATVTANANTGGGGGGAGLTDASSAGSKQSNTTSPFSLSSSRPRFYPFSNQSKA